MGPQEPRVRAKSGRQVRKTNVGDSVNSCGPRNPVWDRRERQVKLMRPQAPREGEGDKCKPTAPGNQRGRQVCVKTRERRGSSFSQLGLEPNHTGLTAQSLFFLEESCRVKRSDTQTFSNFSNYFKRVLKLQKRSSSFSK